MENITPYEQGMDGRSSMWEVGWAPDPLWTFWTGDVEISLLNRHNKNVNCVLLTVRCKAERSNRPHLHPTGSNSDCTLKLPRPAYHNLLTSELFFFNFSTHCIQNVNNTGTKNVRIMKQTVV